VGFGSSVVKLITPPEAFPYKLEAGPRITSMLFKTPKDKLSTCACPSGVDSGIPSTNTLTPRMPKAALAPNPRIDTRKSCAKLLGFKANKPGTLFKDSLTDNCACPL